MRNEPAPDGATGRAGCERERPEPCAEMAMNEFAGIGEKASCVISRANGVGTGPASAAPGGSSGCQPTIG